MPEVMEDIEQCSFCKEWFPKPVSLHHSQDECTVLCEQISQIIAAGNVDE